MKSVVFACLLICVAGSEFQISSLKPHQRIVGGEEAEITEVPWQVALLYDAQDNGIYSLRCGGSIISETVVLTAAQCIYGTRDRSWRIRVGSQLSGSGGQTADSKIIKLHPSYDFMTLDYDVAVVILSSPLTLDGVTKRAIAMVNTGEAVESLGEEGIISGWGSISSGSGLTTKLRKVTLPIIDQDVCAAIYAIFNPITPRMVCAGLMQEGGKDACQGDSGGPLVVGGKLAGITSWGRGCGQKGFPGVWARVEPARRWIDEVIEQQRRR